MNIKDEIRPISYIKSNITAALNQVNETRRPIVITQNGDARAVLMDAESYNAKQKAMVFLKLTALGEKEIKQGKLAEQSDFFAYIDKGFRRQFT
jgi:prevent-host-death family protein